jgi:hypothetical protein
VIEEFTASEVGDDHEPAPKVARNSNGTTSPTIRDRVRELRRVRAGDLHRNPKNWRRHPDAQAAALKGLLSEIGYADALIVRELPDGRYMIIDGHLRAETTPDIMVPVLVLDVTEEEADKLLLALDPLAAMAESDEKRITELLRTVKTDNEAIKELFKRAAGHRIWEAVHPLHLDQPELSPDLADQLMEKWGTKAGQLWRFGPNHLIIGDSDNEKIVERLFQDVPSAHTRVVTTDPAHGVSYAAKNEFLNALDRGNRVQKPIASDNDPDAAPRIFAAALRVAIRYAEKGASCYATVPSGPLLPEFIAAFNQSGFSFRALLVWVKNQFVLGRSDYNFRHESVLYGWIENGAHYFIDDRTKDSVFEIDKPSVSAMHPTSKPVALIARMIENSSRPDELVYDPFAGSGTSLVAAHQLGRVGYGCEIDPCYAAVIIERLSMLGLEPELVQ